MSLVTRIAASLLMLAGSVTSLKTSSGNVLSGPAAKPSGKLSGFRSVAVSLWLRLITIAIVALVFSEALMMGSGRAQTWTYFLSTPEIVFEAVVRLVFAGLAGIALGTVCTAIVAPFLWYFEALRERVVEGVTRVAVVIVLFLISRLAVNVLISWSYHWFDHRAIIDKLLRIAQLLAFPIALCIPRARKEVVTSLDGFLSEKMTRRIAVAAVVGAAALAVTEFAIGRKVAVAKAALAPERPKTNFLLITFDALNAEDISLYGGKLPTTPNLDAFGNKATVFTNFFSASTFTTPSLGVVMTGMYSSQTGIYHMEGEVRGEIAKKSLPQLMRAGGYATGAFLSNPLAYYLGKSVGNQFDLLPEPAFHAGALQRVWDATRPLHQDSGIGSQLDEYLEFERVWSDVAAQPHNLVFRYRAAETFAHAREMIAKLPDGYFLWIHVMTPHDPYLPDAADRGRFITDAELRSFEEESDDRWKPHYKPGDQAQVDKHHLGYEEFLATADRAFGSFMSDLERNGKLRNTTVIVSADHGESFEGGIYQHRSAYQTRPVIHIPLMIRTPGQQESRKIAFTADQTALAPTILELAGRPKPDWMPGHSLVPLLNREGQGEGNGMAFTQYFENNSRFRPLHHGTVGVIDGSYQYVIDLETNKGSLRPLNEAQIWNIDRSAENPARAEALRAAIYSRFPELKH